MTQVATEAKIMRFYNLKTRSHVEVPDSAITKMKSVRATKNGNQTRYMLTAEHDGMKLYKFVNQDTFNKMDVPEGKGK